MTLQEAYIVARAIADCSDPPVIRGIFDTLTEELPHLEFCYSEDMRVKVIDTSKGIPIVIKDPE